MLFSNYSKYLSVLVFIWLDSCKVHTTAIKTVPTTKPDRIGIEAYTFRGTLFREGYMFNDSLVLQAKAIHRFTPTIEEIEKVESLLKQQIKFIDAKRINKGPGCPIIHKHIQDYFRQYIGFIDSTDTKIIHINFLWDKSDSSTLFKKERDSNLDYETDYQTMFGGCSHYWIVSINLATQKVVQFSVNGPI